MNTLLRFLRWLRLFPCRNPLAIRFYQDAKQQWRWQFWRSGQIVAEGGESYCNLADCQDTVRATRKAILSGNVIGAP